MELKFEDRAKIWRKEKRRSGNFAETYWNLGRI